MKKILLSALLASAMSIGALAEVNVTVTPLGDHPGNDQKRVVSTADVLVNEDFSAWENGTEQEPEFGEMMGTYENPNIDPFYMHGQQWQGYKCYQAGGTCALRTFDPMGSAYVETPKGDWSGSVHISFLAKYLKVEWEDENGEKWHWSGSGIKVGLSSDSDCCFITTESYDQENGDTFVKLADVRLYDNQGWCQVDIDFDNYSAFNDAYLTFYSGDGVLLDDIKITTTADNFIASPVVTEITDVTETSFKVKFEPVRKAYNYYGYLYEFLGYNEETGEPEYKLLFDPEVMALLESGEMGMTYEEYLEEMGGLDSPYVNFCQTEKASDPCELTFYGLDPAKEYYFAICSHYVRTFSERTLIHANVIAVPEIKEAADIKKDGFTAVWSPVTKADNYEVTLYGVNQVQEDTDSFIIFEEDFDNVSAFTDATDINNPTVLTEESGITLDDLTSTPGWEGAIDHIVLVEGKIGLDDWNYFLTTPKLYVSGSDNITISACLESPNPDAVAYFRFNGKLYQIPLEDGRFEGEFEFPTEGAIESSLDIAADGTFLYIDYLVVSQNLKKGALTFTYMGNTLTENGETEMSFSGLDTETFDLYGYSVRAFRGDLFSEATDRMVVDMKNGSSWNGIDSTSVGINGVELTEVARYTLDGRQIDEPVKGINIVRYNDGSIRKVMVK